MIAGRRHAGLCVAALLLSLGVVACRRGHAAPSADPAEPTVVVRPESDGLLLTWIDDKGDFHVETRVADVPMMGRDAVRVVDPNRDESAHPDSVFVVDLRQSRADGSYPVRSMTRTDFEAMAVARREKTGPTLASAAPEAPPNPASSADPSATEAPRQRRQPVADRSRSPRATHPPAEAWRILLRPCRPARHPRLHQRLAAGPHYQPRPHGRLRA